MSVNKKTILFILHRECTFLPPFMTILDCLKDKYSLKVISRETPEGLKRIEELYQGGDVTFLAQPIVEGKRGFFDKVKGRVDTMLQIPSKAYKEHVRLLESTKYDLLWVIHEETAFEFRDVLIGKKYLLSLYELNDHRGDFLEQIKPVIKGAQEVLVAEYNRACILRVWLQLDKTPTVVPNKPLNHPLKRNVPNSYQERLEGKKIILYQGYINRSRKLDKVCEAVKDMTNYCIVLMGKGDVDYINELKQKYPQILHISFIAPPEHLYVTSWAHIAIVKYDFVYLNAIFCAPNKTWEYTGFGIPVLCHAIPGLQYTIGKYKAGICTDLDDVECVKSAITEIDKHYDEYSKNAQTFYNSYDVKEAINLIAEKNLK